MRALYRGEEFNPNFYYYSNVDIDHSWYIESKGERILLTSQMNKERAHEEFKGKIITYKTRTEIEKIFKGKTIEADLQSLGASTYLTLSKWGKVRDVSKELGEKRQVKTQKEQEIIKKAALISQKILDKLDPFQFKTEKEIHDWLLMETLKAGAKPAYEPIVAADRNSRFPHYHAQDTQVKNWVLIDYAVALGHYASDLTRCYSRKEKSKEMESYRIMQEIFTELVDMVPSCKTGAELAGMQENIYKKHKLPPLIHSVGHGIGLEVHELPRLSKRFNDPLAGTVLAIEPATYNRQFGVRYENTLYVGKKVEIYKR